MSRFRRRIGRDSQGTNIGKLEDILVSLPTLRIDDDFLEPADVMVLPVSVNNGLICANYVLDGVFYEVPLSFSHGNEKFSFGPSYSEVPPPKRSSLQIPLTEVIKTEVTTENKAAYIADILGVVFKGSSYPLMLYHPDSENEFSVLDDKHEILFPISQGLDSRVRHLVEPIIAARQKHRFAQFDVKDGDINWIDPQSIAAYLDGYIIGQQHAKEALAVAFSNYMVRKAIGDEDLPKDNVILIGGTGTGKTQSVRLLAERAAIPFFKTQMTGKSTAGYVGENFLTIFESIKRLSNGAKAPYAIVFLDEIDKLGAQIGTESFHSGLQDELIGILEEGIVAGISTRNIHFVGAGAFSDNGKGNSLADIIAKRMGISKDAPNIYKNVRQDDLIEYGLKPELVGRMPVIGVLDQLSVEEKVRILTESKGSVLNSYIKMLRYKNYEVVVGPDFPSFVAENAPSEIGARGLQSVCYEIFKKIFFDPSRFADGGRIVLSAEMASGLMELYKPPKFTKV